MKKCCFFVLVLLLVSTAGWGQAQEPITIKLSEFDVTTPNAMLSDFATELSYIPLETHPDEMVGAEPILDFKERGLLNLDGKRYGKHLSLAEAIEGLDPQDNPVLVVIKMKN